MALIGPQMRDAWFVGRHLLQAHDIGRTGDGRRQVRDAGAHIGEVNEFDHRVVVSLCGQ